MLPLGLPPWSFPLGYLHCLSEYLFIGKDPPCVLPRQNCTGRAIRRLHLFTNWCATILTSSSAFMTSGFSRNMAIGVRLFVLPWTSFSNAVICVKDLRGFAVLIAVKRFSWRFRAGSAAVARPVIRSGRFCRVCAWRRRSLLRLVTGSGF